MIHLYHYKHVRLQCILSNTCKFFGNYKKSSNNFWEFVFFIGHYGIFICHWQVGGGVGSVTPQFLKKGERWRRERELKGERNVRKVRKIKSKQWMTKESESIQSCPWPPPPFPLNGSATHVQAHTLASHKILTLHEKLSPWIPLQFIRLSILDLRIVGREQ